jgi:outer membrane receptor protein involved in Fe transport
MRSLKMLSAAALAAAAFLLPCESFAQQPATGRIVGKVVDAATGEGLADAGIVISGTTIGAPSGVGGRFTINGIPAGTVTLIAKRIGYAQKTITGVTVEAGKTAEQNITLAAAAQDVATMVVTASAQNLTVADALNAQKVSVNVVSAVTLAQITRSPDGNAAQTVQRVSGITVQDGKYVFARGLGERYTTSSLNGARIPSPEPEKRVVPLDMFPAGLLQSVTTTKTFTPDQQGDFSGALVNIKTREFPAQRTLALQLTGGYVPSATGTSLIEGKMVGGERFAMVNHARDLPAGLSSAGNFQHRNLTQADKNNLIASLRDAWVPSTAQALPNGSAALSFGGNDPLLFGHRLGYLLSGTFSSGTDLKDGQIRALANRGNQPGETVEIDRFEGQTASQDVLWGGLANLSTMVGTGSRIAFNGMYNRTADNDARVENGSFENEGFRAQITRMQYVQRSVHSAQLSGDHQFGPSQVEWSATLSGVRRYEPDRSEFVQGYEQDTQGGPEVLRWVNTGNGGAVRTFSDLTETSKEFSGSYKLAFSAFTREHSLKVGALARTTQRNANTRAYAISGPGATSAMRELPPEELFDGRFTNSTDAVFDIGALSQGGSYKAHDDLSAVYAMTEFEMSERLRVIGGARYEMDDLTVDAASTLGAPVSTAKHWNDLLPALAFNVKVNQAQQVRLSLSRTLARPEYRELSPIKSRDVLNGDDTQGNDQLQRTNVSNADLRWEWYPESDEVLSVALFAKKFDNPIERVYQASGSGTRTVYYTNAKSASNFGVEFEVNKNLEFISPMLAPLALSSNVTLMQSSIDLGEDTKASATNLKRRMVGQAPYVVNAGLTYTAFNGASATLLYNRVGERIDAAGDKPLPDVIEKSRDVLDFSLRLPLTEAVTMRLDAKNLFDAPYETVQGTVIREWYRAGRTFVAGFQWRP